MQLKTDKCISERRFEQWDAEVQGLMSLISEVSTRSLIERKPAELLLHETLKAVPHAYLFIIECFLS